MQPTLVATHGAHVRRILEGGAAAFEGVPKAIGSHDGVGLKFECCGHGVLGVVIKGVNGSSVRWKVFRVDPAIPRGTCHTGVVHHNGVA